MGTARINDGEIMVWRRIFAGRPEEVGRARQFVSFLLADHAGAAAAAEAAAELFVNAARFSRSGLDGGQILIEVRRWPSRCATVAVTDDGGENEPIVGDATSNGPGPPADRGRGLALVGELADCWGWTGDVNGRTVTTIFLETEPW
jgi:anti-sigma regulatory factor (Ser/Thr protein kinase)